MVNLSEIDPSLMPYIEEAERNFPKKPYEIGAKDYREIFAEHSNNLRLFRNRALKVEDKIIKTSEGEVKIRIYNPSKERNGPTCLFYLHGGGWIMGDLNSHDKVCVDICLRCKITIVAIDYVLAPEKRYPSALNQCYDVYVQLTKKRSLLGKDYHNFLIGGDSAGGNLALALSIKINEAEHKKPTALVLFYPCLSLNFYSPSYIRFKDAPILDTWTMIWFWKNYLNNKLNINDPCVTPITAERIGTHPYTILCTAAIDPLASEGIEYVRKLKENGVSVSHVTANRMVHGFIRFRDRSTVADRYFWEVCLKINDFLS